MESLLTKTNEVFSKLFELVVLNVPVSIVVTDHNGIIEYVNPKFCEVSGYTIEEARGQNPRILKSGEKNCVEYKQLWDTISSGKIWHGVFHNKKKNGELYWENAIIAPVKGGDNTICNYIAIKEDITALVVDGQLLALKNKTLSEIAFFQSHIVRGPLATLIGLINLIKSENDIGSQIELLNSLEVIAGQFDEIIHLLTSVAL